MLSKHPRKTRQAFTLVELLVVVLILAILMAVALPLYLGAIQSSQKGTARANMQTIANANQAYKLKSSTHSYTTELSLLDGDLTGDTTNSNPNPIVGPGDRQYVITLGDGSSCDDGFGHSVNVPVGSFKVTSVSPSGDTSVNDGCFVPGVTSQ